MDKEEDGGEQTCAVIEAFADEFVGSVDIPFVIERDEDPRDHHHGQRKPEVELHEAHAFQETLARCAEEGDGAGLCGHHTECHRPPAILVVTA